MIPLCKARPDDCFVYPRDLLESFFVYVKLGLLIAFFYSLPLLFFEAWGFVAPGLYKHEKRIALPFSFAVGILFTGGSLFGYFVIFPPTLQYLYTFSEQLGRLMKERRPQAIACANDRTAGQVMRSLLGLKYRIPQNVRLVGIDDVQYATLLPVALTTIHQPGAQLGLAAGAAMLERVRLPELPPRDILLDCRLVVRDSCGAHAAGDRSVSSTPSAPVADSRPPSGE